MIPFWENLEKELRINYFLSKHFEISRINESEPTSEETALFNFFLSSFGEEHLNLKCIVSVDFETARAHLGSYQEIFPSYFFFYVLLISVLFHMQKKWL